MLSKPWQTIDSAREPDAIQQVWPAVEAMDGDSLVAAVRRECFAAPADSEFLREFNPLEKPADSMAVIEAISAVDIAIESLHWGGIQHNFQAGRHMPSGGIFESATWYSYVVFEGWPITIVDSHIGRLVSKVLLYVTRMAEHLQSRRQIAELITSYQKERYKEELEKAHHIMTQTFMEQQKLIDAAKSIGAPPKKWTEADLAR